MLIECITPHSDWQLPPMAGLDGALRYRRDRRSRRSTRTISFTLIVNSKKKIKALLYSFIYTTRFTRRVLETLRESPDEYRANGAFALLCQSKQQKAEKGDKAGTLTSILANLIAALMNSHLTQEDYEVSSKLRDGVYREVAKMLLVWHTNITKYLKSNTLTNNGEDNITRSDAHPAEQNPDRLVQNLYFEWKRALSILEQAQNTLVPFGRNKGKRLKDIRKRELRWLSERLLDEETIEESISLLEVLLHIREPQSEAELDAAQFANHPWKETTKHQRATRVRQSDKRTPQHGNDRLVLLGDVSQDELEKLYDELLEQRGQREQFKEISDAVDLLLQPALPRYPTVDDVAAFDDAEATADRVRNRHAALNRFSSPFPVRPVKPCEEYSPEELADLEDDARTELLRADRSLGPPRLQPLAFKRTMRPGMYSSFALLIDRKTGAYVLALVLAGRGSKNNKQHYLSGFTPAIGDGLEFFNFDAPFRPPADAEVLLFSLAPGSSDYHKRYLDSLREYGLHRTQAPNDVEKKGSSRALIGSARITCRPTKKGGFEFTLHIPVPVYETQEPAMPTTILGIHEHDDGYTYAVTNLAGDLLETGEVAIEPSVLPRPGDNSYNRNYAPEAAVAIRELAGKHKAYIAIEDTSYRRTVTTSRTRNRRYFARPSATIASITAYKALEYGLLAPHMVRNVAPSRDCANCGIRNTYSRLRRLDYCSCPFCNANQPYSQQDIQQCNACGNQWTVDEVYQEWEFACTTCKTAPIRAQTNTAIVVARKTMISVWNTFQSMQRKTQTEQ